MPAWPSGRWKRTPRKTNNNVYTPPPNGGMRQGPIMPSRYDITVRKEHTHEDRCQCTRRKFGNSACGYRAYLRVDGGRVCDPLGGLHATPAKAREALAAYVKELQRGQP